jgi:tryptophan synthase beta chain
MNAPSAATQKNPNKATSQVPDSLGRFGEFGRRFVPETLMHALEELTEHYAKAKADPAFQAELAELSKNYVGRPSPLYFAERLTKHCGGARIFLKRGSRIRWGRGAATCRKRAG